jgi:hypothetical protein
MTTDAKIFWIASYPRSGNTLMRIMLSQALLSPAMQNHIDAHFPSINVDQPLQEQAAGAAVERFITTPLPLKEGAVFESQYGPVKFVKTHWGSPDVMDTASSLGAAYFLRHPIDVFLSGLNYIYFNAERIPVFREYFLEKTPRSVDEIAERGELSHYLGNFIANSGFWPFQFSSKTWVESVRNWSAAATRQNITIYAYSKMVAQKAETLFDVTQKAGIDLTTSQVNQGVIGSTEATQPDGKFYWRGGGLIKAKYLQASEVALLEDRLLRPLGIDMVSM